MCACEGVAYGSYSQLRQMVASIVKAASGMSLVVAKVVQMFALSLGQSLDASISD